MAEDAPVPGLLGRGDTAAAPHHGQAEAIGCGTRTCTVVGSHTCCTAWQSCQICIVFSFFLYFNKHDLLLTGLGRKSSWPSFV